MRAVLPVGLTGKADRAAARLELQQQTRPLARQKRVRPDRRSRRVFRTRDLLVRQRTQLINAIRGHLAEYGWIAPKGPSHVAILADLP
jgi:transposase